MRHYTSAYNVIPLLNNSYSKLFDPFEYFIDLAGQATTDLTGDPNAGDGVKNVLFATSLVMGKGCPAAPKFAAKTAPRVLTLAEKALYGRVSHPKDFRQQVWERAKAPDGNVYDPTGRILKYDEPWELGHRPGHKFSDARTRAAQEGWDRQTWTKYQNDPDIYRPELPSSNADHRWE